MINLLLLSLISEYETPYATLNSPAPTSVDFNIQTMKTIFLIGSVSMVILFIIIIILTAQKRCNKHQCNLRFRRRFNADPSAELTDPLNRTE